MERRRILYRGSFVLLAVLWLALAVTGTCVYASEAAYSSSVKVVVFSYEETTPPEIVISLNEPTSGIYRGDATATISVTDPTTDGAYSGLKSVQFKVYNMGNVTQQGMLFRSDDSLTSVFQRSYQGTITIDSAKNNSNDVALEITAEDHAGNVATEMVSLKIDITAPTIVISYDNNSSDAGYPAYFKETRTATIRITERNFKQEDVNLTVTRKSESYQPTITWKKHAGSGNGDDIYYTAEIPFMDEGDYTLSVSYTDTAGNRGSVSYATGTVAGDAFTIDRTAPQIVISGVEADSANGGPVRAVVTVTDTNYETERVTASLVGLRQARGSEEDSSVLTDNKIGIAESNQEDKMLDIQTMADSTASLTDTTIYDDENQLGLIGIVQKGDKLNEEMERYMEVSSESIEIGSGIGEVWHFSEVDTDDVYVLSVTATDRAGNVAEHSIRFSVNRNGSYYEIINQPDAVNDVDGTQLRDLVIEEHNPDALTETEVVLYHNKSMQVLTEGVDYTREDVVGEDGWHCHTYTVFHNAYEEDGIYEIVCSSVDAAGNRSASNWENKDADVSFVVDWTQPFVLVTNLESGVIYQEEQHTAYITVRDNLLLAGLQIILDGEEVYRLMQDDSLTSGILYVGNTDSEIASLSSIENTDLATYIEQCDEDTYRIRIPDSHEAHTLTVIATDAAGNTHTVTVDHFYVSTGWWVRFRSNPWPVVGVGLGVLALFTMALKTVITHIISHRGSVEL